MFGGCVGDAGHSSAHAGCAGHVNDDATGGACTRACRRVCALLVFVVGLLLHRPEDGPHHAHRCRQIDRQDLVPHGIGHGVGAGKVVKHASNIDKHIDAARQVVVGSSMQADARGVVACVGVGREVGTVEMEAAVVGDAQQIVVELGAVDAADPELVGQEQLGAGEPDARSAAGDNGNTAVAQWVDRGRPGLVELVELCVVQHEEGPLEVIGQLCNRQWYRGR